MLRVSRDVSDIADEPGELGHDFGVGRPTDLIHLSRPALPARPDPSRLYLGRNRTPSRSPARRSRVYGVRVLTQEFG